MSTKKSGSKKTPHQTPNNCSSKVSCAQIIIDDSKTIDAVSSKYQSDKFSQSSRNSTQKDQSQNFPVNQLDFSQQPDLPALELKVLDFWDVNQVFARSISQRQEQNAPDFTFYDGPPFATGLPHYGHLLQSAIKDTLPRYQTMKGCTVPRIWGWDCHGLPIENIIEKELNLHDRKSIEKYGIAKFNEACRAKVLEYRDQWREIIHRFGRFVDMDNDYKTMDPEYMSRVWGVFKQLWDKNLIYHGHKSMYYCPRCATPLSNFEVTQGYKPTKDISVTVKFLLTGGVAQKKFSLEHIEFPVYALAWTTTPWTLPANVLLAINPQLQYAIVEMQGAYYILAANLANQVFAEADYTDWKIIKEISGAELDGLRYQPIFPYYADTPKAFHLTAADFVDINEGVGIVHVAPAFGEDDYYLGESLGIPLVQHVDTDGRFKPEVTDFAGLYVKPIENPQATDIEIIRYLASESVNALFAKKKIEHSYPYCWRCDTPLLNYATDCWFVKVKNMRDRLLATNDRVNWQPEHIKYGRFGNWLADARDWAISRNRYWGTPLPVWQGEKTGQYLCIGSQEELELLSGQKVPDLHKHFIDQIIIEQNGEKYRHVPEVFDCWFESGSMPYGADLKKPADFIAEGQDQTRGWFYTLHVLATALRDEPAFNNCLCSGIILAEDGKKMSKKLKNYPDPEMIFDKYGVDAMRLYLLNSPAVKADTLNFSEKELADIRRRNLIILWNVVGFYLDAKGESRAFDLSIRPDTSQARLLDHWLLAKTDELISKSTQALDKYELNNYVRAIFEFIDQISTWYLRLSRSDLRENNFQAQASLNIFGWVLLTLSKIMAPAAPFSSEVFYQAILRSADEKSQKQLSLSVHLADWPKASTVDSKIINQMNFIEQIIETARASRQKLGIKLRQPLAEATIFYPAKNELLPEELNDLIAIEINVKQLTWQKLSDDQDDQNLRVDFKSDLTPELIAEGQARELMRAIAEERKKRQLKPEEEIFYQVNTIPDGWQDEIEKKTNARLEIVV